MSRRLDACVLAALLGVACSGCSSTPGDPLEWLNRPIFAFNNVIDDVLLAPAASVYVTVVPKPLRTGVSNFFDNLNYPMVAVNSLLQGKPGDSITDIGRFIVNSTAGVAGFFDVATDAGLVAHDEDFGQTLGTWGVGAGPYIVLPLLGPTTLRDAPDHALASVTSVLFFIDDARITIPATVTHAVDQRARHDAEIRAVREAALDAYVYTRESFLQHRLFLIHDGAPPADDAAGLIDLDAIK